MKLARLFAMLMLAAVTVFMVESSPGFSKIEKSGVEQLTKKVDFAVVEMQPAIAFESPAVVAPVYSVPVVLGSEAAAFSDARSNSPPTLERSTHQLNRNALIRRLVVG